ncbi:4-(cytidine 5'-diphospho)-2-C-methyl-D-erythritol kinase [Reichenbachiella sp. MSK19-1]|uniref:4-(cytidine 5'-diphospho)-2-C-methyl-D-erythritol kinase n=1 Tax=Reichenbachiella sp. MSK19-1 TaxID=1897631 RepID=UPI000E6D045D|nr:4-(cytidine 5'-diphospho)-2-C-methyl-D-erythritol kinase [Reichenbachiella sp. MSK19-1]RJE73920.1 4-(cytidine 5'-diphospho)-2-C-methyl-D-erythritol kinase [Reichenbachiella sp. MSK19-1]
MIAFPNAKINLGLNILSKRPDGYHNISSCFVPISWCDALEIVQADAFSFTSSGLPIPGNTAGNLVVKAYETLRHDFDLPPVQMHLHKVIPMGAGMGGGSADGAYALRLLNELFDLQQNYQQLEQYAASLGADCPFFIRNQTQMVGGIGDEFETIDLDLSGYKMVVIYPEIHVDTSSAFRAIRPQKPTHMPADVLKLAIGEWRDLLINDFEQPVFAAHPELAAIKQGLYNQGAHYAAMSGSGSSVYGLFATEATVTVDSKHKNHHEHIF